VPPAPSVEISCSACRREEEKKRRREEEKKRRREKERRREEEKKRRKDETFQELKKHIRGGNTLQIFRK
jgi:uncharacterized Zn finger protein (UPF0148 family)